MFLTVQNALRAGASFARRASFEPLVDDDELFEPLVGALGSRFQNEKPTKPKLRYEASYDNYAAFSFQPFIIHRIRDSQTANLTCPTDAMFHDMFVH